MNAYVEIRPTDGMQKSGKNFFPAAGTNPDHSAFVQPKLTINSPHDEHEQEADAMADKVMLMEDPGIQLKPLPISCVQRKCEHCEEEEKEIKRKCEHCEEEEKEMQRKEVDGQEATANNFLESYVGSLNGSGQSLPDEVRNYYEPRFGYDFSNVRVHTDPVAANSAQSINALAYTTGKNIVFNRGQYSPGTDNGNRLLGHELTHVVQQNGDVSQKLQRFTCDNNPATAPAIGMSGCSTDVSRPIHPNENIDFSSMSTISPAELPSLSAIAARWHANARNETVRIDGFASCEGGTSSNWQLSCNRTKAIETELKSPSDGSPGIPPTATFNKFAHGETQEFSTTTLNQNRKSLVTLQPTARPLPGAIPAAGPTDFKINRIPRSSQSQIFFAPGSSVLNGDAVTQINNLKLTSPTNVRVIGYSSMEEPVPLALARANAVRARLIAAPNAVTVTPANTTGNASATANRSDFASARNVDILVGAAVPATTDCAARDPNPPHNLLHPPKEPCASMDPTTESEFTAALPVANDAMTNAMNFINPAHADHNPILIRRFFGNSDPGTLATLAANMGNLKTHVSGLPAITKCGGQCDTGPCEGGSAIAYNTNVDALSTMTLCVPGFKGLHINDQARNLIHESAHGTSPLGGPADPTKGTKDVAYRHERMIFHLSPADRLRNSDSYALFALFAREVKRTGISTAVPAGIRVPATDNIIGITGADRSALELALAFLEKRLTWAADHSNQLFTAAQRVRTGAITWAATWTKDYMTEASLRFPVTAPPASPTINDMTILAAIVDRYKTMKADVKRDLTISSMPTGLIHWPVVAGRASNSFQIGPDFFRAIPENQISLLIENLASATPSVETAFIPAYTSFAKYIHDHAS